MAVNESFTGKVYPPDEVYEVGREKIREFVDAVAGRPAGLGPSDRGSAATVHPVHVDPQAAQRLGYPDVIAPPTFAVIVAQRSDARLVRDPEAGIDFSRVVHGEQSFTHHRPIVAGDRLQAELTVDSVTVRAGNAMVTTRSEITTEAGERVCTAVSMLVVRPEEDA